MKQSYSELSNIKCPKCSALLKQNLVQKKQTSDKPIVCYSCYSQGRNMSTASEVRAGKKIGRKKGIYVI